MHVILDVSRLLFSVRRSAPSGIDRVEMAYAQHWAKRAPDACTFVAQIPIGGFAVVPRSALIGLLDATSAAWEGVPEARRHAWRAAVPLLSGLGVGVGRRALRDALAAPNRTTKGRSVFLLISHCGLDRTAAIAPLRRAGAAFVPFVHDLIPLSHPEYARRPQVKRHAARMANVSAMADGVVVNSVATADSLRNELAARGLPAPPAITVAPLGIGTWRATVAQLPQPSDAPPYFVCLGTIEPRKNHLLLLHLWRDFAARLGDRAPRLLLLGRRGWENENILDLLERCSALRGLVRECGTPGDAEAASLLAGSRALLFPSFAEGYGLPLAEALALGVPALCSDLPALREVGGAVPDYLDPLDGAAWRRAVLDYAEPASAARDAQLARLRNWRAPGWGAHFDAVDGLLERVVSGRAKATVSSAPGAAAALERIPA